MPHPDNVTEAIVFLAAEGYRHDLHLEANGLRCDVAEDTPPVSTAVMDYTFRFEGPSDPGDEAIVLGVSCPNGV